ncbi:CsgG/HfaB family protein [Geopsychrobacter electrodiphilus]|uniref:CsgG/HfaB family protein n=1 Tax=Geopsychrobacter electrodiphilus TaxID=225196 RepID=UPI0003650EE4|nr:CsgG/HfaB family protein [Geopsychrobacter electrodiphilus]
MFKTVLRRIICAGVLMLVSLSFSACMMESAPVADNSATSRKLANLPQHQGPKKTVTIYEFKSEVPEISAQSSTDMFTTALVKSHTFLVMERQRLEESVYREKQLNQQGMTTGNSGNKKLTGADYIFVGVVTEANPTESRTGIAGTVKGLGVESSGEKGEIGLDVRVLDAATGAVIDAVNVRKKINEGGYSVSGLGGFLNSMTNGKLGSANASVSHDKKEGVDKALRACIEEAVYQLASRYGS